ncbi:MAG: entericidin A/B family lipoprotein [Rubrivivax sp.]|jgi:predicted small secreted protein|nr:entericidin A/B family lipoprotein [Rubrivivax sp.]
MKRHPLLVLAALVAAWLLAGCNTVQGLGKDLSAAGQAIEGTARKAK